MTWDEVPDALLLVIALSALLIWSWAVIDGRSWAAAWVSRGAGCVGGRAHLAFAVGASLVFLAIAEDVLRAADTEWVYLLDRQVERLGHAARLDPMMKGVAQSISFATGAGLGGLLVVATVILLWARRWRAAALLVLGTIGAVLLDLTLKDLFQVARPGIRTGPYRYGFPSGHTFVTLVAGGLLCWIYSRGRSGAAQLALYATAFVAAIMAGGARIVLNAHWLSDIVAGLALGICYLVAVLRAAERLALLHSKGSP